jgi:hypothetical protein
MKNNLQAIAVEDNGGGLALYITKGNKVIWSHSGYEYNKGQLSNDMQAFCKNQDISDWDGDEGKIGQEAYRQYQKSEYGYKCVAEVIDGKMTTYPNSMGSAASLEFLI